MKITKTTFLLIMGIASLALFQSCGQAPNASNGTDQENSRGEPLIVRDTIIFEKTSNTFSLIVHADSTAGADVMFYLLDGDSILMQNSDGHFNGIAPFEEGYNVQVRAVWPDTTIISPRTHVSGFIVPREPIEKLDAEELQRLIITRDAGDIKQYLAQGIKINTVGSERKPELLQDVIVLLDMGVWPTLTVTNVTYDENNYITTITLKPTEQQSSIVTEDEKEEEMFFDEY